MNVESFTICQDWDTSLEGGLRWFCLFGWPNEVETSDDICPTSWLWSLMVGGEGAGPCTLRGRKKKRCQCHPCLVLKRRYCIHPKNISQKCVCVCLCLFSQTFKTSKAWWRRIIDMFLPGIGREKYIQGKSRHVCFLRLVHLHVEQTKNLFGCQCLIDLPTEQGKTECRILCMGVSKNNGTPKSSNLIGFSIINHFGVPLFLETPTYLLFRLPLENFSFQGSLHFRWRCWRLHGAKANCWVVQTAFDPYLSGRKALTG